MILLKYRQIHASLSSLWYNVLLKGIQDVSVDKEGVHKKGVHKDGVHEDGVHKDGVHKDGVHKDGVHKDGVHKDGVHKDGVHEDGARKNGHYKIQDAQGRDMGVVLAHPVVMVSDRIAVKTPLFDPLLHRT